MTSVKIRDPRDVLLAPVVSEKSYGLLDENKYTFLVTLDANKTEIKIAVESVFKFGSRCEHAEPARQEAAYPIRLRQASRYQARDRHRRTRRAHRHLLSPGS